MKTFGVKIRSHNEAPDFEGEIEAVSEIMALKKLGEQGIYARIGDLTFIDSDEEDNFNYKL